MRISIRAKIFIGFSILLVVSLSLVTWIWYEKYSRNLRESSEEFMIRSITEMNDSFELTMKDIDYISTMISLNRPNVIDVLIGDPEDTVFDQLQKDRKLDNYISSLYGYKYYISGISVVSGNGRAYSQGTSLTVAQFQDSPWYASMTERQGRPVFVTTHAGSSLDRVSEFPSQNVVSIARTIRDGNRQVGYVLIDFGYEFVQRMFSRPLVKSGQSFLLDGDGRFVYAQEELDINRSIRQTKYADVLPLLQGSSGRKTIDIGGEPHFLVYYKSQYTDWTTVALVPKNELLADSRRAANTSMIVPLATLIAALLVATVLARQITRNIGILRNAMKRVGSGNLTETIAIRSHDEVEELSRGFNQMVESIKNLVEDVRRTDEKRHEMEFKALQAQINPHFLFNTLNQIRWLADIQKADNIKELVSSLLALLHSSMGKGGEYLTVREEIDYLRHYLNIQEYRYYDKFEAVFDFEEEILDGRILKFLLQPLVENALIHGIEPLKGKGLLTIRGFADRRDLVLQVSDNGIGMTPERQEELLVSSAGKDKLRFSGIGLSNVQERIRMHYGPSYGLELQSVSDLFTTATIRLPYRTEKEEE